MSGVRGESGREMEIKTTKACTGREIIIMQTWYTFGKYTSFVKC